MGLFGMIGKMASSKVVEKIKVVEKLEKVADELNTKQNHEQTSQYFVYINNNLMRVCKLLADLLNETRGLVGEITSMKGVKMSFREKGDFGKIKDKANKNLRYLYLARDFFTALSKNASGILLKDEELMLVSKFAPYFDGVPVLDIVDEDRDYSVLGAFKEVGQELMSAFVSSKKSPKHFDFKEYMFRYYEKLEEFIIPDIESAVESFKNAMASQESPTSASMPSTSIVAPTLSAVEEIECPNCRAKLNANSKFCLECGNKIEIKKTAFCTQCGEPVAQGAKFCANCGTKV